MARASAWTVLVLDQARWIFWSYLNLNVLPVVGSEASTSSDKAGQLRFRNKRAEMYWRLREALNHIAKEPIALPPDSELLERPN